MSTSSLSQASGPRQMQIFKKTKTLSSFNGIASLQNLHLNKVKLSHIGYITMFNLCLFVWCNCMLPPTHVRSQMSPCNMNLRKKAVLTQFTRLDPPYLPLRLLTQLNTYALPLRIGDINKPDSRTGWMGRNLQRLPYLYSIHSTRTTTSCT